jgi:hypothetical protein
MTKKNNVFNVGFGYGGQVLARNFNQAFNLISTQFAFQIQRIK